MKSGIFYFSGAGNSKAVAKEIANNLHANICKNMGETTQEDLEGLEQIGLVFPVYYFAPPTLLLSFLRNVLGKEVKDIQYLFVIMTHGGMSFYAPSITERLLEESGYVASYTETIKMIDTYIPITKIPSKEKQNVVSKQAYKQVQKIIEDIKTQEIKVKARWPLSNMAFNLFKRISEWRYNYDKKFVVDSRCTSCGVCVEKCPVNNIILSGKSIEYLHHCEQCFACYHHCPTHAITLKKKPLMGYSYYKGPTYFTKKETV
jgi:ferredoxin